MHPLPLADDPAIMIHSLLYVSVQAFAPADSDHVVDAIVAVSRRHNADHGITGALIATERHFAQIIEGSPDAVDSLFASILRDQRHRSVTVLSVEALAARRFGDWSLAYAGRSRYLEHYIAPLPTPHVATTREIHRLIDLMQRLAATPDLVMR